MNHATTTHHTVTPWGIADSVTEVAPGITFYSTPSHGGYHLSPERRAAMPPAIRDKETFARGNWYEEDCDWALVALAFPAYFPPEAIDAAHRVCAHYHQDVT